MSDHTDVHARACSLFVQTFGESHASIGGGIQWMLQPSPRCNSIHVLLNGPPAEPVLWVFDPNDPTDGVLSARIKDPEQVPTLIHEIRHRMERAARTFDERAIEHTRISRGNGSQ